MSTRESGFLPTIKCSQCGLEVEISMMGEHICSGDNANSHLSPPLEAHELFEEHPPLQPKDPRKPVAVDTGAANRPFLPHDLLTPISQHSNSPRTPYGGLPSGRSTDYLSNTLGSSPESMRRPNGYGGLGDSPGYTTDPLPSPGAGVFQRMENLVPGPFDHRATEVISPLRKGSLTPSATFPDDRPSTANSYLSGASGESIAAPRLPHKASYDGFGPPPRAEPGRGHGAPALGYLNRSETFPQPSHIAEPPARTPSAPGTRAEGSRQSAMGSRPPVGPDTSRRPPPRKSLIPSAHKNAGSVDLAKEFGISNPYHTPTESVSSGYSSFSQPSHTSSQTSPARSPSRRQTPHDSRHHGLMEEVATGMESLRPDNVQAQPHTMPRTPSPLAESPAAMSPATSPRGYGAPPPVTETPYPVRSDSHRRPGQSTQGVQVVRRGTGDVPSRGDCKGCGQPIVGKSISSADGRLTGRYHKSCFVCTTCAEPFASAEFYVLDDKPYCEQHYHKLNGSLCGGCGWGIEGKFVADETSVKYHLQCFCCPDCGRGLADGYFEVEGRAYCEQDAWNRVNRAPAPAQLNGPGDHRPRHQDPYAYRQGPPPPQQQQQQQQSRGPPQGRGPVHPRPPQGMGLPGRPNPGQGGPRPRGAGPGPGAPIPRPNYAPQGGRRPGQIPVSGLPHPKAGSLAPPRPVMNKRSTRLGML